MLAPSVIGPDKLITLGNFPAEISESEGRSWTVAFLNACRLEKKTQNIYSYSPESRIKIASLSTCLETINDCD